MQVEHFTAYINTYIDLIMLGYECVRISKCTHIPCRIEPHEDPFNSIYPVKMGTPSQVICILCIIYN